MFPSRAAPIVPEWGEIDTVSSGTLVRGTFWKARVLDVSDLSVEKGAGGGDLSVEEDWQLQLLWPDSGPSRTVSGRPVTNWAGGFLQEGAVCF